MTGNINGNAYALTILSPIINGFTQDEIAYSDIVRNHLQDWNALPNSPMVAVPNTYLCRYFVLDDVYTESLPGAGALDTFLDFSPIIFDKCRRKMLPKEDHLKSRYLVFSSNFYCGPNVDLDGYLTGMWNAMSSSISDVWQYCYGFKDVLDADPARRPERFVAYMKKCQLTAAIFFVGSNDDSLDEQLKALYLKQEFSQFAAENQGLDTPTLKANFRAFLNRVAPINVSSPTWAAGKYRL